MAGEYTVGDLVAEFLTACGVRTVFGIVSVHNIPMLDAIGRRNAIRFMMARGELGGAHMADGYARVTGDLGVLFTSTGPGAANAVGGLIEAQFRRIAGAAHHRPDRDEIRRSRDRHGARSGRSARHARLGVEIRLSHASRPSRRWAC